PSRNSFASFDRKMTIVEEPSLLKHLGAQAKLSGQERLARRLFRAVRRGRVYKNRSSATTSQRPPSTARGALRRAPAVPGRGGSHGSSRPAEARPPSGSWRDR